MGRYEGIFYPKEHSRYRENHDGTVVDQVEVFNSWRFDRDCDDNINESLNKLTTTLETNAAQHAV